MIKIANIITISDKISSDSFTDTQIMEASVLLVQSVSGEELPYNTFSAIIDARTYTGTKFIPKGSTGMKTSDGLTFTVLPRLATISGDVQRYDSSAKITISHDGKLFGKFYVSKVSRISKTQYKIEGISSIGLLDKLTHYGGLYTEETPVGDILQDIFAATNIEYSVEAGLENALVKGWLPIDTRRNNLQQILFAINAGATTDENGNVKISPLYQRVTKDIDSRRVFRNGSVSFPNKVGKISLSQHTFTQQQSKELVQIFEGTIPDDSVAYDPYTGERFEKAIIMKYPQPMRQLSYSGASPDIRGNENFVLLQRLSPDPNTVVKASGYPNQHTIQTTEEVITKDVDNSISIQDRYLVSDLNAKNIMSRLKSFYSSSKVINTSIAVENELPGDYIRIVDPFGDVSEGIIKSMNIKIGKLLKAELEVITDYIPPMPSGLYNKTEQIISSGSWTVPQDVEEVLAVVIGGGNGGGSGYAGDGGIGAFASGSGSGGKPGTPGEGGKVFKNTLKVTPGQSISVTIGRGGTGGGVCSNHNSNNPGTAGGETKFGNISSNSGKSDVLGFTDILDKSRIYATPGRSGISGGSSGQNVTDPISGRTYYSGRSGSQISNYAGLAPGGTGGGPAVGNNGTDGSSGVFSESGKVFIGGNGGSGADAVTSASQGILRRGMGGDSGNGGGGGGNGPEASLTDIGQSGGYRTRFGSAGTGGTGSPGKPGQDGIVLLYYYQKG